MPKFLLLLIPALFLVGEARSAQPMTLEDIARLQSVGEIRVSPDGRHVALVRRVPRAPFEEEDGEAWGELHVITDEGPARRFIRAPIMVSHLRWSPDSKGIYFLAKRGEDKHTDLHAIAVDGGEAFKVCSLESNIAGFSIHPDGSRVALLATPKKPEERKKLEEKGFKAKVYEEDVFHRQVHLATLDEASDCETQTLDIDGHVVRAEFSPQGDRLLMAIAPTPLVDDGYMQTRLRITNLEGGIETRIENLGKLGKAVWSPDGTNVAFVGVTDINDPREGRLKVADAGSGQIRELLPELEAHVLDLLWGADGSITTLIHRGVESEVRRLNPETGEGPLVHGPGDAVIRSLSASADGSRWAVLADRPSHPAEVHDLVDGELVQRSNGNPWLAERQLARQETVRYQARDGLDLEGLLIYPLDYQEGQRYPMIIYVHGGPESHRSDGWLTTYSAPIQVASAEGYFAFVPNYRGSTGRGVAFTKLHQHAYARPEFDDIVDGKSHLVDRGLVDPDRVGITGGSYGGYATGWSATALTEHYAAGVMFVGISDQISKFGTTDIPAEMYLVHSRAWPWDDWMWMLERSPIYHTEKSRTPLLIMHGDKDPRVHPSQSLEMYRYLKLRGQAPVRLVLYPDEKHGNRKAAGQYDYSRRMMRWMDHYLKGPGGEPPPYEIDYSDRLEDNAE